MLTSHAWLAGLPDKCFWPIHLCGVPCRGGGYAEGPGQFLRSVR